MLILDFINDLSGADIFIFILVIFILIFLIFLSSSLLKKNKELRVELTRVNDAKKNDSIGTSDNNSEKQTNLDESNIDSILENNINLDASDVVEDIISSVEVDTITKEKDDINEILKDLPDTVESGPYKKNLLRELSAGQTSPVNIGKNAVDVPKMVVTSYVKKEEPIKVNNDLEENTLIKNMAIDNVVSADLTQDNKIDVSKSDNKSFVEEISKQMAEEIKPQTIELTDYEKQQEEEAIISYKELINAKDRLYKITDDEEIDSFIDELKEFRTNLE